METAKEKDRLRREKNFIRGGAKKHKKLYGYEFVHYINNSTKVKLTCKKHGIFEQQPNNHLQGKGCNECKKDKVSKAKKDTLKSFSKKAIAKHGVRYIYNEYIDSDTKINIGCKIHGNFLQTPNSHLQGIGCPKCGKEKAALAQTKTKKTLDRKIKEVHGNLYTYEVDNGFSNSSVIEANCKVHGKFKKSIKNFLKGQKCPKCSKIEKAQSRAHTQEWFEDRGNSIHNSFFDYTNTVYKRNHLKVEVGCPIHGPFTVTPNNHISKMSGCPKCACVGPSKAEDELYEYVKTLTDNVEQSNRKILNGKELDIYMPFEKLAIEYNGIYFHSDKFKENNYHLDKTLMTKAKGIELIHIYGDQWRYNKEIIKDAIFKLINKSRHDNLGDYIIQEVNEKDKSVFLKKNHIESDCKTDLTIGLYSKESLVAIMSFNVNKNVYTLVRYCNKIGVVNNNTYTIILEDIIKNYQLKEVLSYVNNSWPIDNFYSTMGFEKAESTPPDYMLVAKKGAKRRKCKTTKGSYHKIYDCGKTLYKLEL